MPATVASEKCDRGNLQKKERINKFKNGISVDLS
jgi:hypothetical protein